ncbi:MAG: gliding motility protein GldN [Bacteroidales bacterium]|nr:gliding motility protein GldN [Bacteroidales bacterium]
MKARRYLFGAAVLAIWTFSLSAQTIAPGNAPVINSYSPSTDVYKSETIIPEKKPVPYGYIREADVMWGKDIWRSIDLRHRQNMPLRYPLEGTMSDGERYSLFGLLMEGIKSEEITPYQFNVITSWKDPFSQVSSLEDIYRQSGGDTVWDDNNNFLEVQQGMTDILQFQVQEQWYFDMKHSTMKVRIVALAPIYYQRYDEITGDPLPSPRYRIPFVVHFPQCRRLFATHSVYNPNNDAQTISFDDLFMQRRFSSTIIAESNVFGNRMLIDYKLGQDVLLEAERIKADLFNAEHDLWEY